MKMNDGFLLVATHIKSYLTAAQMLCESIKDYHPKADVALYTEDRWLEDPANDVFDHVYGGMPNSQRSKLLACSMNDDYDRICYIDADCFCQHYDIQIVHDLLQDKDIIFTPIREYNAAKIWWEPKEVTHPHGGWYVYQNSEKMKRFMLDWWDNWNYCNRQWRWKYKQSVCRGWDQFPLGIMLGVVAEGDPWYKPNVRWGLTDSTRWNYINGHRFEMEGVEDKDIVIQSYSSMKFKLRWEDEHPGTQESM